MLFPLCLGALSQLPLHTPHEAHTREGKQMLIFLSDHNLCRHLSRTESRASRLWGRGTRRLPHSVSSLATRGLGEGPSSPTPERICDCLAPSSAIASLRHRRLPRSVISDCLAPSSARTAPLGSRIKTWWRSGAFLRGVRGATSAAILPSLSVDRREPTIDSDANRQ